MHNEELKASCPVMWAFTDTVTHVVLVQSCDAVLALRGKIKAGGWLRTAAKGFAVPIFSVKTGSPEHLTRAVQTILGIQPSPSGMFGAPQGSRCNLCGCTPSCPQC